MNKTHFKKINNLLQSSVKFSVYIMLSYIQHNVNEYRKKYDIEDFQKDFRKIEDACIVITHNLALLFLRIRLLNFSFC